MNKLEDMRFLTRMSYATGVLKDTGYRNALVLDYFEKNNTGAVSYQNVEEVLRSLPPTSDWRGLQIFDTDEHYTFMVFLDATSEEVVEVIKKVYGVNIKDTGIWGSDGYIKSGFGVQKWNGDDGQMLGFFNTEHEATDYAIEYFKFLDHIDQHKAKFEIFDTRKSSFDDNSFELYTTEVITRKNVKKYKYDYDLKHYVKEKKNV